jgi:hypothetical protein
MAGRDAASSVPPDEGTPPPDRVGPDLPAALDIAAGPIAFETAPLSRRRTFPTALVVVAIAAVLGAALLKPWGGSTDAKGEAGGIAVAATSPAATDAVGGDAAASSAPGAPAGSAEGAVGSSDVPAPETLALIVTRLAADAGAWGIGVGGAGPRLVRDDPWTEWQPIDPVAGASYPRDLVRWPGTDLCLGVPQLYDRPSLLAVTVPPGLEPDWRILTWRSDGTTIAPLTTLRQVSPPGNRQISYLEYPGTTPWPDGRYEFHVVSGDHILAMTVCLTRLG